MTVIIIIICICCRHVLSCRTSSSSTRRWYFRYYKEIMISFFLLNFFFSFGCCCVAKGSGLWRSSSSHERPWNMEINEMMNWAQQQQQALLPKKGHKKNQQPNACRVSIETTTTSVMNKRARNIRKKQNKRNSYFGRSKTKIPSDIIFLLKNSKEDVFFFCLLFPYLCCRCSCQQVNKKVLSLSLWV